MVSRLAAWRNAGPLNLTPDVIFSAIPDEIGKLQNLKELNLAYIAITGEWNPLYVAPMLHLTLSP